MKRVTRHLVGILAVFSSTFERLSERENARELLEWAGSKPLRVDNIYPPEWDSSSYPFTVKLQKQDGEEVCLLPVYPGNPFFEQVNYEVHGWLDGQKWYPSTKPKLKLDTKLSIRLRTEPYGSGRDISDWVDFSYPEQKK